VGGISNIKVEEIVWVSMYKLMTTRFYPIKEGDPNPMQGQAVSSVDNRVQDVAVTIRPFPCHVMNIRILL